MIANKTPKTITHHGAILGIEIANKIAVKTAEPSLIEGLIVCPRNLKNIASEATAVMQPNKI